MKNKAKEVAKKYHAGQVDKSGVDYFKHVETVAKSLPGDVAKSVGFLHDIIEDTELTAKDLKRMGFTDEIVDAVVAMTKRRGESYEDYLHRVKKNRIARVVKLADLKHNMDMSRIKNPTEKDFKRLEKYKKAVKFLS